jgi:putative hydrolase of the HAD superfamily
MTEYKEIKMQDIKAVLFDLDDVFYPRYQYVLSGYKAVARYMFSLYGTEIYQELAKQHDPDEVEKLFTDVLAGHFKYMENSFLNKLSNVYWLHTPNITLYKDMKVFLLLMKSISKKLCMVTDGRPEVQKSKVQALNLSRFLDTIIYAQDLLGDNKIFDACQLAELFLNVPAKNMMYIGNLKSDFCAVNELGITSVLLQYPDLEKKEQDSILQNGRCSPSFVVNSLNEIYSGAEGAADILSNDENSNKSIHE